jgi:hypothetical protein
MQIATGGSGGIASGSGGSSTGSGGSAGTSTGTTDTPESVCREALTVQCQRRVDCGTNASLQCFGFTNLCPDYYFGPGSKRTVEGMRTCITALRQMPCSDVAVSALPDCLVGGERAAGMGCAYGSQCASAVCEGGSQQCAKCAEIVKTGSPCGTGNGECEIGAFCHPTTNRCESIASIVHGAEGATCNHTASPVQGCAGDLVCRSASGGVGGAGTCAKLLVEGSPCTGLGGFPCAPGLVCARGGDGGGICQSLTSCGATTCDAMSYCNHQTDPGTCAPRATEGKACSITNDKGQIPCVPGTLCAAFASGGQTGVCFAEGTARTVICSATQPCPYPMQCVGGHCAPLDPASCN